MSRIGPWDAELSIAFDRLLRRYGLRADTPLDCEDSYHGWTYESSECVDGAWWHRFRGECRTGIIREMIPATRGWIP